MFMFAIRQFGRNSPILGDMSAPTLSMSRATARFQCLQGDCPDTCCAGFRVGLSTEEYDRLSTTLSQHPETKHRNALVKLSRPHSLNPTAPGADASFAQDDGRCVLLDTDGLCAVHRHFGEQELATVCALYPRTVVDVEGDRSVFLTLACPEAARLILLEEDAFESAAPEAADGAVPEHRSHPHRTLTEQTNTPLRRYHVTIERITCGLEARATSLREALFFLAVFADSLEEAKDRDDAEVQHTLAQFDGGIDGTVEALREAFNNLEPPSDEDKVLPVAFAADLIAARLGQGPHPRFADVAQLALFSSPVTQDEVIAWFSSRPASALSTADFHAAVDAWTFGQGQDVLDEDPLRAMLRHALRTEWWIRATSLRHVVAVFMTRVSLVRLLAARDPRPTEDVGRAQAVIVDAVQLVAKNISHVPTFARLVELALEERDLVNLPGVLKLLPPSRPKR